MLTIKGTDLRPISTKTFIGIGATNGLTKVNADAEKLAGAIRQVIQTYQKIAAGMKDNGDGAKIASAIRGFADLM